MKAEKAEVDNFGKCGKCGKSKTLPQHSKTDGDICEDCYLEKFQIDLPLDEYTLQPDELTKEQFAEKAQVTIRAVEIWKAAGKLPSQKLRRRIDGTVRKTTIFKTADVEEFLKAENSKGNIPKVENTTSMQKTNTGEQNDFLNASQMFVAENLGKFADSMNNLTESLVRQLPVPGAPPADAKPFLNIREASEFSEISESCLRQMVKDAALTKFTGKHGEVLISRKQLLNL
ncbi:MAG: hypothetical protein ACR2MG_20970 [Pyrinomonadaceae bacterium]